MTQHDDFKIRLVNPKRDLPAVADLIENCFSSSLDIDGKNYVQQIRRAAVNPQYRLWYPGAGEWVSSPVFGYVCEIDRVVVGNLSLIPFHYKNQWLYLIANVAVHEDYRRLGIAHRLTRTAIEHVQKNNVAAVWLQVRADNDVAIHLYKSLGFEERATRINWQYQFSNNSATYPAVPEKVHITTRDRNHWDLQRQWLEDSYPPEIAWYLSFSKTRFSPSILQKLSQVITGSKLQQWSASLEERLIGVLTWQPSNYHADTLWLAAPEEHYDLAIRSLIPQALKELKHNRPLLLNFPTGKAEESFEDMNFSILNKLIWMKIQLL